MFTCMRGGFGPQRRLPPFLTLPSPRAAAGLPCEGVHSPFRRPRAVLTSGHRADASEPTCSKSKAQPLNLMKVVAVLSHWSSPCAPHHAETRLCISLPLSISFIANIARKRPELHRGKTRNAPLAYFRDALHPDREHVRNRPPSDRKNQGLPEPENRPRHGPPPDDVSPSQMAQTQRGQSAARDRSGDCVQGRDQATSNRRLITPSPTFGHSSAITFRLYRPYARTAIKSEPTKTAPVISVKNILRRSMNSSFLRQSAR